MDERVAEALEHGGVMDITTTGRRTGQPRRIELVFHNVDGRILISGRPGFPRSWVANLKANPRFTFHLKRGIQADLPATGRVITDREERERLLGADRRRVAIRPGRHGPLVAAGGGHVRLTRGL